MDDVLEEIRERGGMLMFLPCYVILYTLYSIHSHISHFLFLSVSLCSFHGFFVFLGGGIGPSRVC